MIEICLDEPLSRRIFQNVLIRLNRIVHVTYDLNASVVSCSICI